MNKNYSCFRWISSFLFIECNSQFSEVKTPLILSIGKFWTKKNILAPAYSYEANDVIESVYLFSQTT